jgi:hypothetical protein
MPTVDRGRLDQHESLLPPRPPPSQAHLEKTVRRAEASTRPAEYALSFAKTGAAHLLVTLANVSGIDRPDDRDSWRA